MLGKNLKILKLISEIDKQIIYYNDEDKERLQLIFEQKAMMYEKFSILLQNLEKRLKDINNQLENATDSASESDYYINKYKSEKDVLEEKKTEFEQKIGEKTKDSELKTISKTRFNCKNKKVRETIKLISAYIKFN